MALGTYTELQAAIARTLVRTDLTASIPDYIAMAEAAIARDVRDWRMNTRAPITLDARYVALPADWVETVRITTNASGYRALRLVSTDQMERDRAHAEDVAGIPSQYALVAGQIEVYPTPSGSYAGEIVYRAKVPALSDGNETNWLLTAAPDLYLYGSCLHSAPMLQEDQRLATWGALYQAAVNRLNEASDAAQSSGTSLRMAIPR